MRQLIFIAFTLTSLITFSQSVDCEKYKKGKFILRSKEYGNSYIKRNKKYQIEKSFDLETGQKIKTKDKIEWIDDCSYKLLSIKIKDPTNLVGDAILVFRFIETTEDYYIVGVSGLSETELKVKVHVLK